MTSTKSCGGSRSGPGKSEKIAWWARLGGPYNIYIYIYYYIFLFFRLPGGESRHALGTSVPRRRRHTRHVPGENTACSA